MDFVRLFLVFALSESLSNPLITAAQATGNIRRYQSIVGGLILLNLPASYIFLKAGAAPEATVAVAIVISQICFAARLFMLRGMIGLDSWAFFRRVWSNVLLVSLAALPLPHVCELIIPGGFCGFLLSSSICVLSAGLSIFFIGCSRDERKQISGFVKKRIEGCWK